MQKPCLYCGTSPLNKGGKYCSIACYHADASVDVICSNCSKPFRHLKSRVKKLRKIFCSRSCRRAKSLKDCYTSSQCKQCKNRFTLQRRFKGKKLFCSPQCRRTYFAPKEQKCYLCKKTFLVKPCEKGRKFCSLRCRSNHASKISKRQLQKKQRPCKWCGKLVTRYPSQFRAGRGKYCSRRCYGLHKSELQRATRLCEVCNNPFTFLKNRLKRFAHKHRYCSWYCYSKSLEKKVEIECLICGAKFRTIPARVKNGKTTYCSADCAYFARKMPKVNMSRSMIYTPEFLRMLLMSTQGNICSFPGCNTPRSPSLRKSRWNTCANHARRINASLKGRWHRREAALRENGL